MEESKNKKKRGRPRTFEKGSTTNICVTIEKSQKEWLDEVAASAPQESISKVVREALDLWHAVHKEGKAIVGLPSQESIPNNGSNEFDDFDYSWK